MPQEPVVELVRVFVGLGSNIEPRLDYLNRAVEKLRTIAEVVKVSAVYETAPVGGVPQPHYLNAAVEILTPDSPLELLAKLRGFELALGRKERPRWHEREIDFDILFYEDLILDSEHLTIPHPEIAHRAFVLAPLTDLDRNFIHPILHKTVGDLLTSADHSGIIRTDLELA